MNHNDSKLKCFWNCWDVFLVCLFLLFATFSFTFLPYLDKEIHRLENVDDFLNVNVFFKCKYVRINDYSFKYVCIVCSLKIRFYCLTFYAMPNLNPADLTAPNSNQIF